MRKNVKVIRGAKNLGRRVIRTSKGTTLVIRAGTRYFGTGQPAPRPESRPYDSGKKTGDKR
jgi:hypothetical protein